MNLGKMNLISRKSDGFFGLVEEIMTKKMIIIIWLSLLFLFSPAIVQATKAFDKVPEQDLKDAKSYLASGLAYYEAGKYQEAIRDYDKAIELEPKLVEAYINRGGAHWMLGNSKQAIENYKIAAQLGDKKSQDFLRSQGIDSGKLQGEKMGEKKQIVSVQPSPAIEAFDKVPEQDLKDAKSYFARGLANYEAGKYQEAIRDYNKAIDLDSKVTEAYVNRGGAYWMLGDSKQAIEDYKIAASLGHKKSQEFLRSQGTEITKIQGEEAGEKKQIASLPPAPPSALSTEQEIRQFLNSYVNSYNAKSIEGFMEFFSPRAIQNQRDDFDKIRKSYETFFDQMETVQYRITIDKIEPQQNSVEVRGQYRLEGLVSKGRKKENWKGQVRWVLVKEDGVSKILTLDYQPQK